MAKKNFFTGGNHSRDIIFDIIIADALCTGGGRPIRKTTSIIRDKSVTAVVRGGMAASRQLIVADFAVALMNSTASWLMA